MKTTALVMVVGVLLLVMGCASTVQQPSDVAEVQQVPLGGGITSSSEERQRFHVVMENSQFGVENGEFGASSLEVRVGDTIEWVNKDAVEHTVTFENGPFDQKVPVGGMVSYTFTEPGTYEYFCQFHPGMKGVVVVK